MNELFMMDGQAQASQGELKLHFHPPKRYLLSKTIPIYQKDSEMNFFDERLKRKSTKPQYFTNILRVQKKNMFVNTFLRKLKSTIIQNRVPDHELLDETSGSQQNESIQIEVPKFVENIFLFVWLVHAFSLLLLNSMALIFEQINRSELFQNFMIISFLLHCLEIGSKFFVHVDYQENKITNIQEITNKYLKGQFWLDMVVLFGLIMFFALGQNAQASFIFRVMIFGKVSSLMYIMEHLEITLIENEYREQIWSLIKVFLFNFIFAHILTLALVLMARIKENDNWIVSRGLEDAAWSERYIWAYYWATTIMLTVGFGDIVPRNSSEALSLIFIQTMSCIVLAYNINRVGTIIQKIRSYQAEKNLHLKTFNHIKEKSEFSNQTKTRIMNYIKESTEIKRNFNLGEEKEFIESLPQSFKSDLLKEMNRHVWNGMMFFQNLSEQTLVKLSITIQKKLAHPQQILYTRGDQIDIMVFNGGGFGYAYNNGNAQNNGKIMQHFTVPSDKYQIATLDFLIKNKLPYNIKCNEYSVVYKISTDQLIKILNEHSYDSEYFFMIKDKDKFLPNEFQLADCELCKKERHSVFKCPKLHYIPLREHVIRRYRSKYYPKIFKFLTNRINMQKHRTLRNVKQIVKHIQSTRRFVNNYLGTFKSERNINSQEFDSLNSFSDLRLPSHKDMCQEELIRRNSIYAISKLETSKLYQEAFDELRSKIDNMMNPTMFSWDVEIDLAFNFKFYFRKYNSDQVSNFTVKKTKNKVPVMMGAKQNFGYRRAQKMFKIQENIFEMMAWKKKLLPSVRKVKQTKK